MNIPTSNLNALFSYNQNQNYKTESVTEVKEPPTIAERIEELLEDIQKLSKKLQKCKNDECKKLILEQIMRVTEMLMGMIETGKAIS